MTPDRLDAARIVVAHGSWLPPDLAGELLAHVDALAQRGHDLAGRVMVAEDARRSLDAQLRALMGPGDCVCGHFKRQHGYGGECGCTHFTPVNAPGGDR